MSIEWRDVVGYEGLYEVGNHGEVRTYINKTTYTEHHGVRKWKQKVLKDKTPDGRDCRVTLWKDGEGKDFLVHRLVAFAFIPTVPGKNSINHKDGNPKNNEVSNLEWCDHVENNNHAFDNGLISSAVKTILVDTKSGEAHEFRSMSKASLFLGKSPGYLSGRIKKGHNKYKNYEIKIVS